MSKTRPLRLVAVDDETLLTDAFGRSLRRENKVRVIGVCGDASSAEAIAIDLRPDVVLLDVMMPGLSPWRACRRIVDETEGRVRVLFFTGYDRQYFLHRAISCGSAGIVAKGEVGVDALVSVLRRVAAGDNFYSASWQARLESFSASGSLDAIERLSLDTVELLIRLAAGDEVPAAAEACGMSTRRAYRLLETARADLGCSSDRDLMWRVGVEEVVVPEML